MQCPFQKESRRRRWAPRPGLFLSFRSQKMRSFRTHKLCCLFWTFSDSNPREFDLFLLFRRSVSFLDSPTTRFLYEMRFLHVARWSAFSFLLLQSHGYFQMMHCYTDSNGEKLSQKTQPRHHYLCILSTYPTNGGEKDTDYTYSTPIPAKNLLDVCILKR